MGSMEISEERGVRYLHFGTPWIQGAMRIARPFSLELEYTREMMVPLLLHADAWPRSALQIGLGAGSVTKFLHRHRPGCRITVVEIAAEVVTTASRCFRLPPDAGRIEIVVADGHDYVAGTQRRFDLVLVDGFDGKGNAGMLDSDPFYCNLRARLGAAGIAAVNLLRRRNGAASSVERLREAFEGRALALPACAAGNRIALAATGPALQFGHEELRRRALALKTATGLDLRATLARLERSRGDALEL